MLSSRPPLFLPDAPAIPGLRFRYFQDAADYALMAEIHRLAMAADGLDASITADEMALWYRMQHDYSPSTHLIFAEVDREPVAFASVCHLSGLDGRDLYQVHGVVHAAWRRRGLGRALLHHNERRARELAGRLPPETPSALRAWVPLTAGAVALMDQEGYTPVRYCLCMVRPTLDAIPQAPLPPGLVVRPVQPAHYRLIWEAEQEIAGGAWGCAARSDKDYQTWLADPLFDPSLWRVAWDGDEVAGQARSYIDPAENRRHARQRGYTEIVGVRLPWRQRGLATALLCQSLHALKAAGMREAAIFVETASPNEPLGLYTCCGFKVDQQTVVYEKPMTPAGTS